MPLRNAKRNKIQSPMGQPQSFPVQTDRPFRLKSAQYWVVLDQDSRTYRLSLDESQAVTFLYSSLQSLEKGSVASSGIPRAQYSSGQFVLHQPGYYYRQYSLGLGEDNRAVQGEPISLTYQDCENLVCFKNQKGMVLRADRNIPLIYFGKEPSRDLIWSQGPEASLFKIKYLDS